MKKVLAILVIFLTLGLVSQAQLTRGFVQLGVSTSNNVFYQNFEVGSQTGKNKISLAIETYNRSNDLSFEHDREFFAGIKYGRAIPAGNVFDFLVTGTAWVHIDKDLALALEPGIGAAFNVSPNFAILAGVSSPIGQNTTPFKHTQLKGNAGVQIRL